MESHLTAGDLFEIKTNLKPFFGGLGKQPFWQEFPPGFKLHSRSHSKLTRKTAPLNSHPPKDCKLQSLGPGDGKATHVGAFRISEDETIDTPDSPQNK